MRFQFGTKFLLIATVLSALLIGKIVLEIEREREIRHAIEQLNEIPENGLTAEISNPLVLINAANALVRLKNQDAKEAIKQYAFLYPRGNNLQLLWHVIVEDPVSLPELDCCVIEEGLLIKNASRTFAGEEYNGPYNLEMFKSVFMGRNWLSVNCRYQLILFRYSKRPLTRLIIS